MKLRRIQSRQLNKKEDEPVHLTADGFVRLKEKLAHLKQKLPALIEETRRTAAYGDRSENAEYKEAKSTLRQTNWQILSIEDQLKRVSIIPLSPNISLKVELGSTVVLEVDGAEKIYQILGSRETDPSHGRISHQSPLGAALMGRSKGEAATVQTVSGPKIYRIIEIR